MKILPEKGESMHGGQTDRRTVRHGEGNCRFSQFCQHSNKAIE